MYAVRSNPIAPGRPNLQSMWSSPDAQGKPIPSKWHNTITFNHPQGSVGSYQASFLFHIPATPIVVMFHHPPPTMKVPGAIACYDSRSGERVGAPVEVPATDVLPRLLARRDFEQDGTVYKSTAVGAFTDGHNNNYPRWQPAAVSVTLPQGGSWAVAGQNAVIQFKWIAHSEAITNLGDGNTEPHSWALHKSVLFRPRFFSENQRGEHGFILIEALNIWEQHRKMEVLTDIPIRSRDITKCRLGFFHDMLLLWYSDAEATSWLYHIPECSVSFPYGITTGYQQRHHTQPNVLRHRFPCYDPESGFSYNSLRDEAVRTRRAAAAFVFEEFLCLPQNGEVMAVFSQHPSAKGPQGGLHFLSWNFLELIHAQPTAVKGTTSWFSVLRKDSKPRNVFAMEVPTPLPARFSTPFEVSIYGGILFTADVIPERWSRCRLLRRVVEKKSKHKPQQPSPAGGEKKEQDVLLIDDLVRKPDELDAFTVQLAVDELFGIAIVFNRQRNEMHARGYIGWSLPGQENPPTAAT